MEELERKAGYGLVIALSITAMIGTGVFFGPAIAASYAGNASLLAWAALALISLYVGSCFAELSSLFPDVGGVYEFAKQAYGRFASFLVGWITWLVGSITPSLLLVAAVDYLLPSINVFLKIALAIVLLIILNFIAYRGVEASTALLLFFAAVTLIIIISVTIFGATNIRFENYTPFFSSSPIFILVALFFIMESFFGWESATFMGGETKNPQRVIPGSIMITSIFVAVLIFALPTVILGFVPWQTLTSFETPFTSLSYVLFGQTGSTIINIAIFLSLIGSAAGGIVSSPRLILALSRDRLFIEQFSAIHHKRKTPHKAIMFQTAVSILVIIMSFGSYQSLLSMLVPLALIMYISIILTIPILRKKFPDKPRYIKAPMAKIGPILVSLIYFSVIIAWLILEPDAISLFQKIISFILFGVPIYLLLNLYYNPDLLNKTVSSFAPLSKQLESLILPASIRKEILSLFKDYKGKSILEFGSGVGTLTVPLAKLVGPNGKIYATDLSKNNLTILNKRLEEQGLTHISTLHDVHFISRVHPDIPKVDMVFSVGNLSYIQDLKTVLQDMHRVLPENGQICFVEYIDYFWGILPNQAWLDDHKKMEEVFRTVGFSIRVKKRRGLFWKYLFIYGIKSDYDVPVI